MGKDRLDLRHKDRAIFVQPFSVTVDGVTGRVDEHGVDDDDDLSSAGSRYSATPIVT